MHIYVCACVCVRAPHCHLALRGNLDQLLLLRYELFAQRLKLRALRCGRAPFLNPVLHQITPLSLRVCQQLQA